MPVHEEAWTVTTEVENVSKQIGHSVVPLLMALNRWPQILSEAGLDDASTSSTTFTTKSRCVLIFYSSLAEADTFDIFKLMLV